MKFKNFLIASSMMVFSSACFASSINTVASDEYVQRLVTLMAAQSPSGDPVYCSFNKPTQISLAKTANDVEYQIEIRCGAGSAGEHFENIKIFVKGYIEDSQVYVTGLQADKAL